MIWLTDTEPWPPCGSDGATEQRPQGRTGIMFGVSGSVGLHHHLLLFHYLSSFTPRIEFPLQQYNREQGDFQAHEYNDGRFGLAAYGGHHRAIE